MNTEKRPVLCTTLYRKPMQLSNFGGILYQLCHRIFSHGFHQNIPFKGTFRRDQKVILFVWLFKSATGTLSLVQLESDKISKRPLESQHCSIILRVCLQHLAIPTTVRSDVEERVAEERLAWTDKNIPAWPKNISVLWNFGPLRSALCDIRTW